jgi:hypothetical protein
MGQPKKMQRGHTDDLTQLSTNIEWTRCLQQKEKEKQNRAKVAQMTQGQAETGKLQSRTRGTIPRTK